MTQPTAEDLLRRALPRLSTHSPDNDNKLICDILNHLQKIPPCSECGATTPQEARFSCTRYSASDVCHGCELWPGEIRFDAPRPLTVEGVQRLADTTRPVRDVEVVAAAICALADQLVPHEKAPLLMRGPDLERLCQRQHTRAQMLALVAKLKDNPTCDDLSNLCGSLPTLEDVKAAALAQPQQPVELTDEDLMTIYNSAKIGCITSMLHREGGSLEAEGTATLHALRAVLARCGRSAEPAPPAHQPLSTENLFSELDQLLCGIDRRVDHPEGGWWETDDGGRFGKIMLRKIKEAISRHIRP